MASVIAVIKHVFRIGVVLIGISGGALAAATQNDPFVGSIEAALQKNPRTAAAEAQLRAAMERWPQSWALLKPTIDLNASLSHNRTRWNSGVVSTDPEIVGLSLTQAIFNQKALIGLRQARPYVASFEQDLQAAIQGVFLDAASATIDVMQGAEVVSLARNNRELLQHHLEATRSRYKVGEITRTDVSQAESRLAAAQANLVRSENTLAVARARFQEVTGVKVPEGLRLPGFREDLQRDSLVDLQMRAVERPDFMAARMRLQVAEEDVELKRAGHMPTVSLSAKTSRTRGEELAGTTDPLSKYSVDLGLTMPIYAGGMTVSQTAESLARKEATAADLERLRLQVVREVEAALLDLHSARAAHTALETGLKAANDALAGVEKEYQVGTRTALDLLDARNEAFTAQTELAKSRFGLVMAGFKLLHAMGRLNLDALTWETGQTREPAPKKSR
ncbi:MAG: TolC family outer membrane protein [Magnetococcales bacterium]|nr:TolC family outer membrane protein [Magnetococcales bacterium]